MIFLSLAFLQFATPLLLSNITGGLGTSDPSSNDNNNNGAGKDSSGSKSNLGGIIGGVVGGIVALLFIALLAFFLLRNKRRKEEREKKAGLPLPGHHGLASRSDSGSSFGRYGTTFPYEKR